MRWWLALVLISLLNGTVRADDDDDDDGGGNRHSLVFYVNPSALKGLLKILAQTLPARQITIAMNLTTSKETLWRGRPGELLDQIGPVPKDSAVTVVIEGYRAGSQNYSSSRRRMTT